MNVLSLAVLKNKFGLSIFNSKENSIFIINTQNADIEIVKILAIKYDIGICLFPSSFDLHDFHALHDLKIKLHFSVARKLKTDLIEKISQSVDPVFFISLLSLEPLFFYLRKNEDFLDFSFFTKIEKKIFDEKILIGEINCINLILIFEWKNLILNFNCIKNLFLLGNEIHANCAIKNKQAKHIFSQINFTKTAGGKNRLKEWLLSPLIYEEDIRERHILIDHALENMAALKNIFKNLKTVHKIEEYFFTDKKIFFINLCNNLKNFINLCKIFQFTDTTYLDEISAIICLLNEKIEFDENSQFVLKCNANEKIKNLRINYANIENILTVEAKKLQAKYKIPLSIIYIPHFRYLIETFTKNDDLKLIVKLGEIFYCSSPEVEKLNAEFGDIEIQIHLCELDECNLIFEKIKNFKICIANNFISKIDAIFSLALCKEKFHATRPHFVKNYAEFYAKNFIFLLKFHEKISINVKIDSPTVITGENGSGKTAILQSVGHIAILSQMGAFLPADKISVPIFKNISCKIFSGENKNLNCSAFFSELMQIKNIPKNYANNECLFLIDEFGKGCKFEEAVKISSKILENVRSRFFLWTTNFQENMHKFSHIKYLQLKKNEKLNQNILHDGIFLNSCIENLLKKLNFTHKFMQEFMCIKNNLNEKDSRKKHKWVVEKINQYL